MLEVDLYPPVRDWLAANGYEVRGEVGRCDVAARKGDDLILVELKRQFGTDLLVQGVDRQKLSDSVYLAVPAPPCGGHSPKWRGYRRLIKRLELGLLFCRVGERNPLEIVLHPEPVSRRRTPKKRRALLQEIAGRSGDYNAGGSTRRKLLTAYREQALRVACCLDKFGPLAPRQLRAHGTGPKTLSILSTNVYGWFERPGRALYQLTPKGQTALADYPDLTDRIRAELSQGTEA